MAPDRAFGNFSRQLKKREIIADPKEMMEVVNEDCKNASAQWLERKQHYDWRGCLHQFYSPERDFMRLNGEAFLMKARFFSFGFTQVQDQESRQTILVQNFPNKIRIRQVFDNDSEWKSFRVQQEKPRRASAYDTFVAYPKPLRLELDRIRDLRKQKEWLPIIYKDLDMYNQKDEDAVSDSQEDEASTEE